MKTPKSHSEPLSNPSGSGGSAAVHRTIPYRSRLEIQRILEDIARERDPVTADIGEDNLFVTHIVLVDDPADSVYLTYGLKKSTNTLLLEQSSVQFEVHYHGGKVSFELSEPSEMLFNDEPVIRFSFPNAVIVSYRRTQPRAHITSDLSLRCIADQDSTLPFEARITDVSMSGVGCLVYDRDVRLAVGTILKGCQIMIPGGDAVVADLEVRYRMHAIASEGHLVSRAGFRFVKAPKGIERLIGLFMRDLDAAGN